MNPIYRKAIQSIESSGGNYSLLGPVTKSGDRAYGAYQVMGNNIPEWTQRHLGRAYTPAEFLQDKDAQDRVFDGQFGSYVDKYGNPQDAASAWFTGGPLSTGANKHDVLGTSGSGYVNKFNRYINGNGGDDGVSAINAAMSFAPTESKKMPAALSADNTMGFGALNEGYIGADPIANSLIGMGASLAGISNPEQARAMVAQQTSMQQEALQRATMQRAQSDTGSWSMHVLPDGRVVRINSKQGIPQVLGSAQKPEEDVYNKKYDEHGADDNIKLNAKISDAAATAATNANDYALLGKALSNPNVGQGLDGPARNFLNKAYVAMGIGTPQDAAAAADGDIINSLGPKMALLAVQNGGDKLLPGSMSDSDLKLVTRFGNGEKLEPEANRRLLAAAIRHNERVLQVEAIRQESVNANGGRLPKDFRNDLGRLRQQWIAEDAARERAAPPLAPQPAAAAKSASGNTFKTQSGKTINWSVH